MTTRSPRAAARVLATLLLLALLAGCRSVPATPFAVEEAASSGETLAPLAAGAAAVDLDLPPGVPLGGYGGGTRRADWPALFGMGIWGRIAIDAHQAWHEDDPEAVCDMLAPSTGVADPCRAKAVCLRAGDGPPFALVSLDLIVSVAPLHERIVELVADLGYTRASLTISATHTHSGPAAYIEVPFAKLAAMDNFRSEVFEAIAASAARAVREAHEAMRPARVAFTSTLDGGRTGRARVARNRRAYAFPAQVDELDIDPEINLVHLGDAASGDTLCVIANYGVHPTVYGSRSMVVSADLGGAIERAVSARLGGAPVFFFNAAEGDVGPQGEGGDAAERCAALGEAFADSVEPTLKRTAALVAKGEPSRVRIDAVVGRRGFGPAFTFVAAGSRERFWEGDPFFLVPFAEAITLPLNALVWVPFGIDNVRFAVRVTNLTAGAIIDLQSYTPRNDFVLGAWRIRTDADEDVALVLVPGEATHDVGLALKRQAGAHGATRALVIGLANDAMSYIASRQKYWLGGYEAHATLFGPETGPRLLEGLDDALDVVYGTKNGADAP